MKWPSQRPSLLWRIFLSTSIVVTALLALTGWLIQNYAVHVSEQGLEEEVRTSLQAYESLWSARARALAAVSRALSSMSDVRAAFQTRDQATIRDTAQEFWSRVSQEDAIFLVLSPAGNVIASLGGDGPQFSTTGISLENLIRRFPTQVSGFLPQAGRLFYVVLTPVYVQSGNDEALLNILVAGFEVNGRFVRDLKGSSRGSDFAFLASGRLIASTLPPEIAPISAASLKPGVVGYLSRNGADYLALGEPLTDVEGRSVGELRVLRSFGGARRVLNDLRRNIALIWLLAVFIGPGLAYLLARRIVEPVKLLDRAASEVARRNYDYRVPVDSDDELGRLARTFNAMCDSIQRARQDLIRQERIGTIARLSTSIVHDLRNPLAAIYGGAEMLIDGDLPPGQMKRLATSIYRASRRIQELLQDLLNVSGGKSESPELCRLAEVIYAAKDEIASAADEQGVSIGIDVPDSIEIPLGRARMERVFLNLMNNALEAMPDGGSLQITGRRDGQHIVVEVDDTGRGVPEGVKASLFQPFTTAGKKNGLGLGLALSRQTVLDHGGDVWLATKSGPGARFCLRLPEVAILGEVSIQKS